MYILLYFMRDEILEFNVFSIFVNFIVMYFVLIIVVFLIDYKIIKLVIVLFYYL